MMKEIILASSSIYRKQQLERLCIPFSIMSPDVNETVLKGQNLDHLVLSRELSLLKARDVSQKHPQAIIIGGDQVASFHHQILSKPQTPEKAFEQLKCLSGQEHQLMTSLAIISEGQEQVYTCVAKMTMRVLSEDQITRYITEDEPLHSCGSYRLEALGISLFEKIECDDYSSIIGIPLMWTAMTLSKLGIPIP